MLLLLFAVLFALSMGASNIAPSFALLFGARKISFKKAAILFTVSVFLGAILAGNKVAATLSNKIMPQQYISIEVVIIILIAAVCGLTLSHIIKVPESTSWTTVFSIAGAGAALAEVEIKTIIGFIPFWLFLPIIGFLVTYFLYKKIYPPRFGNLWLYQVLFNNEKKLHVTALVTSCYIAFAAGTNNVANVVGPLVGCGIIKIIPGLALAGIVFGAGGYLLGKQMTKTLGEDIVPLGLISSCLVGIVTATLLIVASLFGIPQSLVQISALCIIAIGVIKHERHMFSHKTVVRIFAAWTITPVVSFIISFVLAKVLIK